MLIFAEFIIVSKESFLPHFSYEQFLLEKLDEAHGPVRVGMRTRKPTVPAGGWERPYIVIYSINEKTCIVGGGGI